MEAWKLALIRILVSMGAIGVLIAGWLSIQLPVPAQRVPLLAQLATPYRSDRYAELTTLDCLQLREDAYGSLYSPIREIKESQFLIVQGHNAKAGDELVQGTLRTKITSVVGEDFFGQGWVTVENPTGFVIGEAFSPHYDRVDPKWGSNFDSMMDGYAAHIKAQPVGERGIHMWHCETSGFVHPDDTLLYHRKDRFPTLKEKPSLWSTYGIEVTRNKVSDMMAALKVRGVELDYFHTSNEHGWSNWVMSGEQVDAIFQDPRFAPLQLQVPWLTAQGVKFFWLQDNGHSGREHVGEFNRLMTKVTASTFYQGLYKPVIDAYPKVKISDYAKFQIAEAYPSFDYNGWVQNLGDGKTDLPGSASDLNYLGCGQLCTNGMPGVGEFPPTPWNRLILSLNQARGIYLSNPEKPFHPVLASKAWEGFSGVSVYEEHLMHLYAGGVDAFVFWNPVDISNEEQHRTIENVIIAADKYLGFSDRKTLITSSIDWKTERIETCSMANRKKVCRVTLKDQLPGFWTLDGVKE